MFTAISTALSGISAASIGIDVVGHNLANLNTTGYKDNRVSFQDMMSQSVAGSNRTQVGLGVQRPLTSTQFSQGSIQSSAGAFDAAINGNGFFVVKDANNQTLLTRAGDFRTDGDGNLITAAGQAVQGWQAGSDGTIDTNGATASISVPVGTTYPPKPTSQFSLDANLNARATSGTTFSQQIEAVDSLGNTVPLKVTFSKTDTPGEWSYQVSLPASLADGSTGTEPVELLPTPGTISFDSNGLLTDPTAATSPVPLTVPALANGATLGPAGSMVVNWNVYDSNGAARLTQFAQLSAASANSQDGTPAAQLTAVGLGSNGQIEASYSNGIRQVVGQLAVASVRNTHSLVSVGENNFALSGASSELTVGAPGTGGRGSVAGQSLEGSTADITTEFANLLIFQRSYQANSRVVTASDELIQDTMSLIK